MTESPRKHAGLYAAIAGSIAVILFSDLLFPLGYVFWIFYLVPIALCLRQSRPDLPLTVAAVSTVALLVLYFQGTAAVALDVVRVNRTIGFVLLWGFALMTRQIIVVRNTIQHQHWLRTGQHGLSEGVQGDLRLDEVGRNVLQFLGGFLDAQVGAMYVRRGDDHLRRVAGFALTADEAAPEVIALGEGLVGQAALERRMLEVKDVPAGYLNVRSSLGSATPRTLLVVPLVVDGLLKGVVELGFLRPLTRHEPELLDLLSERIAIAVRAAIARERLEKLLHETQQQAELLQAQQEELRVANEELEEQSQALRETQSRLELQQAELEQTNSQLEEQTEVLTRQKSELESAQRILSDRTTELARASQYKSEFLANMSHELRTPLNSTLILSKLLADNKDGNLTGDQVQFAQSIYSAGNDLLDLINDILDLSKIESGKMDVKPERVQLSRLVEAMAQTFAPMAELKGIRFETAIDAAAPSAIETDPQRLQQILKNLLSNAIKFTERGEVRFEVTVGGPRLVRFSVRDTGIGISPDQHTVIFEAFRQADGTTNRKYGGTGLGLSISRDLARLLGGSIELDSARGRGSTFTLVLPPQYEPPPAVMVSPAPEQIPAAVPGPSPQRPEPMLARDLPRALPSARQRSTAPVNDDRDAVTDHARVLLVIEDDATFARILYDLAHELGFQCVIAGTADEGVEFALQYRPAAIVLDMNLPDHSGLTVLDRLKRNPATRHIPVQVASVEDYTQAALEMGAAGYMLKPVERERLVEVISRLDRKLRQSIRSVLVVEDDDVQRDSICRLLEAQDVRTVAVDSGAAALGQLKATTYDCMVLDISLPDASGFELLERMAQEEQFSFPPVIVYTGQSLSSEEEQRLRRYSRSIIIKGARSPERLLDEVTLFLHQVEANLPADRRRMLQEARSREAVFENRTVLIVEDDVRNVFALTSVLEPRGVVLKIARNGREAIRVFDATPGIDMVLMDIMMPEMNGYEAIEAIRQRPDGARVPIIALTARAMRDDQERCLAAGANDYIAKPIDVEQLLSLMRVWMPK